MTGSAIGGQGPTLLAVMYTETIIAVILVGLRGYAASKINGKWRWDFIWIAVAALFGVAGLVAVHIGVWHGLGNHLRNLTFPQIFATLHWAWVVIFIGLPAVVFAKFSIIALLLSVQGPDARKTRYALYFVGLLMSTICITQIGLSLSNCTPVAKLWEPILPGECKLQNVAAKFSNLQGAVSAFTDLVLALWPISIVYHLKTSMRVKVGFCLLMAIGMLPAIASAIRVTLINKILSHGDATYDFADFMYFAVSELWTVIILGSIPPLRPLFLRAVYGVKSTATPTSYGNSRVTTGAVLQSVNQSRLGKGAHVTASQIDAADDEISNEVLAGKKHGMNIMISRAYVIEESEEKEASTSQADDRPGSDHDRRDQGSVV